MLVPIPDAVSDFLIQRKAGLREGDADLADVTALDGDAFRIYIKEVLAPDQRSARAGLTTRRHFAARQSGHA